MFYMQKETTTTKKQIATNPIESVEQLTLICLNIITRLNLEKQKN
jgi:hypothetical protein